MKPAPDASAARPASSSQRLGFSEDARLLIINADDFGMYPAVNAAVIRSVLDGVASSCSLMAPCPGAPAACRLLRDHPAIPFGIHLTLFADTSDSRWGPLTARGDVPSLLTRGGEFFAPAEAPRLLSQARLAEVELEFRTQINAIVDTGLAPTHLDFHCIADGGRDDILDLTMSLADEYGLALRLWLERGRVIARDRGLPVIDHDFLDSFRLPLERRGDELARRLRNLPPGLSEWAMHPGPGNAEAQSIDPGWRIREADLVFLTSTAARRLIDDEGIVLLDYRPLQAAWSRTRKDVASASTPDTSRGL